MKLAHRELVTNRSSVRSFFAKLRTAGFGLARSAVLILSLARSLAHSLMPELNGKRFLFMNCVDFHPQCIHSICSSRLGSAAPFSANTQLRRSSKDDDDAGGGVIVIIRRHG